MDRARMSNAMAYGLFVALWVLAVLIPLLVSHWSRPGGLIAGIAIPLIWLHTMPCTCRSGGFGAAMLGMWQLSLMIMWVIIGISRIC